MEFWMVENNHRMIFKPENTGFALIDVTIDCNDVYEIIDTVENELWTKDELMDYLNMNYLNQM